MAINFLPESEKKYLRFLDDKKTVFILGFLLLVFFVVFSFALYGVKYCLVSKIEVQKELILAEQAKLKAAQTQTLNDKTEQINKTLSEIRGFQQKEIRFSPVLAGLAPLPSSDIYFKTISVRKIKPAGEKETTGTLALTGFCLKRETLFLFKKNLETKECFSEVWFSPDSWLKPGEIDFRASFNFKF